MSIQISQKMLNRIDRINERDGTSWKIMAVRVNSEWEAPAHVDPWDVVKEGDVGLGRFRFFEYKKLKRPFKGNVFGITCGSLYTSVSYKRHVWKFKVSKFHSTRQVTKFMIEGMEDNKTYSRKEMNELLHIMERSW
jgi:hypothetical protein